MRITSVELAGTSKATLHDLPSRQAGGTPGLPRAFARISRKAGDDYIDVELVSPSGDRTHHVQADCDEDVRSMAECLQFHLDGCRGTNSDIHGYYTILQYFAD